MTKRKQFCFRLFVCLWLCAVGCEKTNENNPRAAASEFEKVGFGPQQSGLIEKVVAGKGTAVDSRRLQLLERMRKRGYESEFVAKTQWDDITYETHWRLHREGDFLQATIALPLDGLRETDRHSAAYKSLTEYAPPLTRLSQLLDEAIESGQPQSEIVDGFRVEISYLTPSTVIAIFSADGA